MSGHKHSQPNPLPLLSRNHTTSTTASNLLLAPDGGVFDSELEHRWSNVKTRLSAVLRNMQDHPLKTLPAEWVHIYTDVAKLYTENDAVRKRRMYCYVRDFIRDLVKVQLHHLRPLGGTVLLSEYVRRWRTTMTYVQFMKRVLHHLQRFWISENANTLKQDPVRPLDKLLMFYWREDLLSNLGSIVNIALSLVDDDRRGIPIDHAAVRGIVDNFVEIGAADLAFHDSERETEPSHRSTDQDISTLQLYIQVFEDIFLVHTRRFYKEEGALMAHRADVSTFIKQVKALLDQEETRAKLLLHKDSAPRVRQAVEEQLIGNHKEFLQQHANNMIEEGSEDDLRLVYNLLDRIEGAMDPVRAFFVRFVRKEGNDVIASHMAKLNGKEEIRHNLVLVELLVRLYLKHASMVKRCFGGANKIMLAIDDAFRGFVNRSLGAVSLPNLLAHYIDQLLRGNKPAGSLFLTSMEHNSTSNEQAHKEPEERNEGNDCSLAKVKKCLSERADSENDPRAKYINELVRILMYLDDKDMFFETHRRLFAKRLLSDHDEDMETLFITKLREQMGTTYTQRLSGMLQDIKISNTLREEFAVYLSKEKKSHLGKGDDEPHEVDNSAANGLKIDFNAHVLNALHWPSVKGSDLIIPDVLQACQKTFSEFYMENTETRKLTWNPSMSTVHVRATWGRTTYMLVVSTFQACTLLLFNEAEEIRLSDVAKRLNVSCEDLKRHIKPLVAAKKSKLLTLCWRPVAQASFTADECREITADVNEDKKQDRSNPISEPLMEKTSKDGAQVLQTAESASKAGVSDGLGEGGDRRNEEKPIESQLAGCEARLLDREALGIVTNPSPTRVNGDSRKRGRVKADDSQDTEGTPMKKSKGGPEASEEGSDAIRQGSATEADDDEKGKDLDGEELTESKRAGLEEVLCINFDFTSRQHRIVVPSLMPRLASVEATVSRKNVVIDRNTQVDAAIMRIMKLRKQVAHGDLCAEVILKMSAVIFTPDVKLIKGRLDRLIDQDYIIRDENDPRMYRYNA